MAKELLVDLRRNSYSVYIEKGLLRAFPDRIRQVCGTRKIFIITDSVVDDLYGDAVFYGLLKNGFIPRRYVVPAGEESKCLAAAEKIYGAMIGFKMSRDDLLITLGGGIVGDLGGFVAATFQRGIPFIQIPTTLLSQVDSSVGGKVAVNLPHGKNMVGAFYQPKAVFIDPLVLSTLSDRHFRGGMAEVVKYGCIEDEKFLGLLEEHSGREQIMEHIEDIIYRCCHIKSKVVEKDELDQGERMLLNFGHTLGHAVEVLSGYAYSHGEGVAVGMHTIARLGELAGMTADGTSVRIGNLLRAYGLPYELPALDREKIIEMLSRDKKNLGDALTLVLLDHPGKARIHKTDLNFFSRLGV